MESTNVAKTKNAGVQGLKGGAKDCLIGGCYSACHHIKEMINLKDQKRTQECSVTVEACKQLTSQHQWFHSTVLWNQ